MRLLLPILSLLLLPHAALALSVDAPLPDMAQEMRAKTLFMQVRCVVCQGEAIADSPAEVAQDMRVAIRKQITAGKTDSEILSYLTSQYGDGILMQPPFKPSTWLLWFGPLMILLTGAWIARRCFKPSGQRA